jgi:hypothetical protein
MTFTRWLRNLQSLYNPHRTPGGGRAGRKARVRFRPRLEVLEDRLPPAVLTVTNNSDTGVSGDGSLRGEIAAAAPGDTIVFDHSLNGQTITLTHGQLTISNDLNIIGPGAGQLTVSGNHGSRVFNITAGTVSLSGLTIANGSIVGDGGGICNAGNLTVSNSTLAGNSALDGGGIFTTGHLTLTNSTLSGNFAAINGGGIDHLGGTVVVTNCALSDNTATSVGGGIRNAGATLAVTNSTLTGNKADVGGGIDNEGSATVTSSTLSGNYATGAGFFVGGGGIDNSSGTLTVTNCALSDNYDSAGGDGGGILNRTGGTVEVTNSYLRHNHAGSGGGIVNGGMLKVTGSTFSDNYTTAVTGYGGAINNFSGTLAVANSTFFNNTATYSGGAINNQAPLTLTNSTLAGNSSSSFGGGLTDFVAPTVTNTIIAGNTAPNGTDVYGALTSQGYNLIGNPSGGSGFAATDLVGTAAHPIDPLLGPLQDNGNDGPLAGAPSSQQVVPTMALLPGSPAIDAGSDTLAVNPATGIPLFADQRGFFRAANGIVDIGAFEVQLYLVYSNADSSGGSLRSALTDANRAGGSVIAFTTGGTINLTSPLPDIGRSVQILGPGADDLTVQRSTAAGTPNFRIFTVGGPTGAIQDVSVAIAGLTIANGQAVYDGSNLASAYGGGIYTSFGTTLAVTNCTLAGNFASTGGGGIENGGVLAVTGTTLAGNSAGFIGGGIANFGTLVTVTNSTLTGNTAFDSLGVGGSGGGIWNPGGLTLRVTDSTLAGNSATYGGGIENSGALAVTNSTFVHNPASTSGGGIYSNAGTVTVTNSAFASNSATRVGGGIENFGGTLKATNCTFSGNSAAGGGGLGNSGTATLTNCTVSGNTANALDTAGGIDTSSVNTDASTTLVNCTVAGNTNYNADGPGGLFAGRYGSGQATVTLGNTIVAINSGSQFGTAGASVGPGTFVSQGHNLSSDSSGNSFAAPTDLHGLDPLLAPLGNYGGPLAGAPGSQQVVPTIALLPGSPAIDSGSDALAVDPDGHPLATDQRGFSRFTSTVDIGAFESRGFTLSVAGGNNQQARVNTPFATPLSVTVRSPFGEPVQGGVVTFAVPPSGASATFPAANTSTLDASGHAAVSVRANTITGTYAITASARGANLTSFTLTNLPGPASHFGIAGPSSVTAGTAFSLTVTALDAYGNVVTDYRGTVRFDSSDNRATLPGRYTYTASDQGVHPFTGLVLRKKGWQTITVIDASNNTILGTISIDVL